MACHVAAKDLPTHQAPIHDSEAKRAISASISALTQVGKARNHVTQSVVEATQPLDRGVAVAIRTEDRGDQRVQIASAFSTTDWDDPRVDMMSTVLLSHDEGPGHRLGIVD